LKWLEHEAEHSPLPGSEVGVFIIYLTIFFSSSGCIVLNDCRIMNLKGCGRKQLWLALRYCFGISLEGLRKTKTVSGQQAVIVEI
jgi:hypothetical protein